MLNPRLLSILAGGVLAYPAAAQPRFTDISQVSGYGQAAANAVSADGNTVAGGLVTSGSAFRWSRAGGLLTLPSLGSSSGVLAANQDGSVLVGTSVNPQVSRHAVRWVGSSITDLGSGTADGVSADGSVIVGSTGSNRAFRWTQAEGMVDLGSFSAENRYIFANGISGNGQVIVGSCAIGLSGTLSHACRWVGGGAIQDLGALPGRPISAAIGTNFNGSVIAGFTQDTGFNTQPMRYTDAGGMEGLGLLPGSSQTFVNGISGDGSMMVGRANFPDHPFVRAVIWTRARGLQDLTALVASMGISTNGLALGVAAAVNQDATVIVGSTAGDFGPQHAFVLDLRGDSDGDGLQDDWEINGIPYTDYAGNPQRYILPGADPAHKDLYVEVDSMAGMSLGTDAIAMVTQAFANAPLSNPDGTTGVRLHVVTDENDLPHVPVWPTDGCWPTDFSSYWVDHYGTVAERQDLSAAELFEVRRKAYRYCIIADQASPHLGGCGGVPGDQLVVFLGEVPSDPQSQASAFMHELGHNLGLGHGGGDAVNGKPNYPSIMNYVLAYPAPWNQPFWRLDYSRSGPEALANLDENSLNETTGIGSFGGLYAGYSMPFGVTVQQGGNSSRAVRYVYLNGTPTDFGDPLGTGMQDGVFSTNAVQDLNFVGSPPAGIHLPTQLSPGELLTAYNDWSHIVLATLYSRGPNAPLTVFPTDELTMEARDWLAQNFPPVNQPSCYVNCDSSTTAPVLNVLDFACFVNRYAAGDSYANCDASTTPPILNVLDFACFLNAYAAGCS